MIGWRIFSHNERPPNLGGSDQQADIPFFLGHVRQVYCAFHPRLPTTSAHNTLSSAIRLSANSGVDPAHK